jgi:hypothetical protein
MSTVSEPIARSIFQNWSWPPFMDVKAFTGKAAAFQFTTWPAAL